MPALTLAEPVAPPAPAAGPDRLWALPAVPGSEDAVREAVTGFAAAGGLLPASAAVAGEAAERAASIAIAHAARADGEDGEIELAAALRAGRLVVSVSDDGAGCGPGLDSPGLSVGLPLMSALPHTVEVGPHPSGAGTRITLSFLAPPSAVAERW
jgi:serine/threonine-protein kinase RsbW